MYSNSIPKGVAVGRETCWAGAFLIVTWMFQAYSQTGRQCVGMYVETETCPALLYLWAVVLTTIIDYLSASFYPVPLPSLVPWTFSPYS